MDHWDTDRTSKLANDEYYEDVMGKVCDVCVSVRKQEVQFSTDRFIRDQRETQLLMSGGSFGIPALANNLRVAQKCLDFFQQLKYRYICFSFFI